MTQTVSHVWLVHFRRVLIAFIRGDSHLQLAPTQRELLHSDLNDALSQCVFSLLQVLLIDVGKNEALLLMPLSNRAGSSGNEPFLYPGVTSGGTSPGSAA